MCHCIYRWDGQVKYAQATINRLAEIIFQSKPLFFDVKSSCHLTLLFIKYLPVQSSNYLSYVLELHPQLRDNERQLAYKKGDGAHLLSLAVWGGWCCSDFPTATCILSSEEGVLSDKTGQLMRTPSMSLKQLL